jgi:CheY-like chemotaxis protein
MSAQVLVVDDDPALRNLLALGLKHAGLAADVASNGAQAVERIRDHDYAVVLLDCMMPVMSGFETVDKIAELPVRPVVIVLTAMSETAPLHLDSSVVTAVIRKPFDLWFIVEIVKETVATMRGRDSLDEETPGGERDQDDNTRVC